MSELLACKLPFIFVCGDYSNEDHFDVESALRLKHLDLKAKA
jgi:hypothetical protein